MCDGIVIPWVKFAGVKRVSGVVKLSRKCRLDFQGRSREGKKKRALVKTETKNTKITASKFGRAGPFYDSMTEITRWCTILRPSNFIPYGRRIHFNPYFTRTSCEVMCSRTFFHLIENQLRATRKRENVSCGRTEGFSKPLKFPASDHKKSILRPQYP